MVSRDPDGVKPTQKPLRRVVLLGASNLTRGISTAVEIARRQSRGPVQVLAALGHGRSYGLESTVLGRTLPGILQCGIWDVLESDPATKTVALLTDIGNDLLYGVPVPRILNWVETCLDRLQVVKAQVVMTLLPLDSLDRLSPFWYRVF